MIALSPKQKRNLSAFAIVVLIGIFIGYYTKSLLYGIMGAGLVGWLYATSLTVMDWARMHTAAFTANIGVKGHSSIIPDDKYTVASPVKGEPNYMIMCAGGSGIVELPMHAFGPYFICPEEFVEETNCGTVAIAGWVRIRYEQLPRFLQEALSWQVHFNPATSEIYFAEVSPLNGTASQSNIELTVKCDRLQEAINSLANENEKLNQQLRSKILLEREVNDKVRYVSVPAPTENKE